MDMNRFVFDNFVGVYPRIKFLGIVYHVEINSILDSFGQFIAHYPAWTHTIIGVAILIQGEIAILASVLLIVNHKLSWNEFLLTAPFALAAGEICIYSIGRILRTTRFGWKLYRNKIKPNKNYQPYFYYLRMNLTKLLIAAKFLIGANFLVLLLAGWTKTKFGTFLRSYIPGVTVWFTAITTLAYFLMSGLSYLKTTNLFRQAEYGIVIVLVALFGAELILRKLVRKRLSFKKEEVEEIIKEEEQDAKE